MRDLDTGRRWHAGGDRQQPVLRLLPQLVDDRGRRVRPPDDEHPLHAPAGHPEPVDPRPEQVPPDQGEQEQQGHPEEHVRARHVLAQDERCHGDEDEEPHRCDRGPSVLLGAVPEEARLVAALQGDQGDPREREGRRHQHVGERPARAEADGHGDEAGDHGRRGVGGDGEVAVPLDQGPGVRCGGGGPGRRGERGGSAAGRRGGRGSGGDRAERAHAACPGSVDGAVERQAVTARRLDRHPRSSFVPAPAGRPVRRSDYRTVREGQERVMGETRPGALHNVGRQGRVTRELDGDDYEELRERRCVLISP